MLTTTRNKLSVENFIPSSISTNYEEIEISLKSAPGELQRLYRQKHSCDVVIKFNGYEIEVHKEVVDKSTQLMRQKSWPRINSKWIVDFSHGSSKIVNKVHLFVYKLEEKIISKEQAQKIIMLMYGYCVTLRRFEIEASYAIARQLQLEELLTIFHNDMLSHFDEYEIFPLMKMANNEQINEVLELCYDQLEIEMYEQLRYSKSGCFLLDEELFIMVLKRHNWQKTGNEKYGLLKNELHALVEEYCFVNGLGKEHEQRMIEDIEDRESIKYHISLIHVLNNKQLTPRKVKSSSEIFFRNTLTLPREREEKEKYNRRLSPFVIKNGFNLHNDNDNSNSNESVNNDNNGDCTSGNNNNSSTNNSRQLITNPFNIPILTLTPGQFSKSSKSENTKSISNYSTDNKSQQNNRSRRESVGSIETISDPRILHTISEIVLCEEEIKESQKSMRQRIEELTKEMKQKLAMSKSTTQKITKMESNLEEIKAEINSSKLKLTELTQTVNNVELNKHKKEVESKFNSLFDNDLPLDLTLSTSFGMKNNNKGVKVKACRI